MGTAHFTMRGDCDRDNSRKTTNSDNRATCLDRRPCSQRLSRAINRLSGRQARKTGDFSTLYFSWCGREDTAPNPPITATYAQFTTKTSNACLLLCTQLCTRLVYSGQGPDCLPAGVVDVIAARSELTNLPPVPSWFAPTRQRAWQYGGRITPFRG